MYTDPKPFAALPDGGRKYGLYVKTFFTKVRSYFFGKPVFSDDATMNGGVAFNKMLVEL
jgi:hypothetical protein